MMIVMMMIMMMIIIMLFIYDCNYFYMCILNYHQLTRIIPAPDLPTEETFDDEKVIITIIIIIITTIITIIISIIITIIIFIITINYHHHQHHHYIIVIIHHHHYYHSSLSLLPLILQNDQPKFVVVKPGIMQGRYCRIYSVSLLYSTTIRQQCLFQDG